MEKFTGRLKSGGNKLFSGSSKIKQSKASSPIQSLAEQQKVAQEAAARSTLRGHIDFPDHLTISTYDLLRQYEAVTPSTRPIRAESRLDADGSIDIPCLVRHKQTGQIHLSQPAPNDPGTLN